MNGRSQERHTLESLSRRGACEAQRELRGVAADALHRKGGTPSDRDATSPGSGYYPPGMPGLVPKRALDIESRDAANGCRSPADGAPGSLMPRVIIDWCNEVRSLSKYSGNGARKGFL